MSTNHGDRPVAVLTGATGGIGRHVLDELSRRGFTSVAVVRDTARLPDHGDQTIPVVWDMGSGDAVPGELAALPRVDVLIHNAAVAPIRNVVDGADGWKQSMAINAGAAAELTASLLPALRAARGHVIVVNSSAGLRGVPGWSAYLASKAALEQLADALREEERDQGVRVTSIYPGAVATELLRTVRAGFGTAYDERACMSAASAARLMLTVLDHPDDAYATEMSLARP